MRHPHALSIVMLLAFAVLAASALPPAAQAQNADPYAAAAAQPPSLADTPLEIALQSQHGLVNGLPQWMGWTPILSGRILGKSRSGDAVIVELAQGGKLLHTMRAGLRGGGSWYEDWEIRGTEAKDLLTASGPLTLTYKYAGADGQTRVLTTRQAEVLRLQEVEDRKPVWKWGIRYDDLPGFSYVNHRKPDGGGWALLWIYCWINPEHESVLRDITYGIEVDGKPLDVPDGFAANDNREAVTTFDQEEHIWLKARNDILTNKHNMCLVTFRPYLVWGPKRVPVDAKGIELIDHPGAWVLKIRVGGQLLRELHFTVDADGMIVPHAEQDAAKPGFMNLGPGRVFVETYFPNPVGIDVRFNPDAIRAGILYGRPWISAEVKAGMLQALPPAKPGATPFPYAKK
jgi:hypothetical protein